MPLPTAPALRVLSRSLSFRTLPTTRYAMTAPKSMPECWGHRGASAAYPENTLASFEAAMRDGAEGIESDVHVSADDVVVMFHDQSLDRTTNGKGLIREKQWYGQDGMEHLRTVKVPQQSIPTFAETVALLMKPENRHVKFNVDVKVQNTPERLFRLMHTIISAQPDFIPHAKAHVPYLRRGHIGDSIERARKYFWDSCEVFSIRFATLTVAEGEKFRRDCKKAGKQVMVWTVNDPVQMVEAVRMDVDVILTDVTRTWLDLRAAMQVDYDKIAARHSRMFLWTSLQYYTAWQYRLSWLSGKTLEMFAGPFTVQDVVDVSAPATKAA
ncbi:PLC-like phosphodiesterase [Amylocystis lapponica]|nr:PLC-like phosphodiesterase [Amylocystis lapponica]